MRWVLIILIFLEGLLSADNALVLAIMSKHLPKEQQKKRLILGCFWLLYLGLVQSSSFRTFSMFGKFKQLGAAYSIFISLKHLLKRDHGEKEKKEKLPDDRCANCIG